MNQATREILEPAVRALATEGRPYRGVLYAGLMLTGDGPKVLEFNCRFGDPEAQVILPRLESDLLDIMLACVEGRLDQVQIGWRNEAAVGVVVASQGYPASYTTGHLITGLDRMEDGVLIFHSGTAQSSRPAKPPPRFGKSLYSRIYETENIFEEIRTAGGRVLTVVGRAPTVPEARALVYRNLPKIDFQGAWYRRDIAAGEGLTGPVSSEFPDQAPALVPAANTSPAGQPPPPSSHAQGQIDEAQRLLAGGQTAQAVGLLRDAIRRDPDVIQTRVALATAYAAEGDLTRARATWLEIIARAPYYAEAFHNLGVVCLHLGERAAAIGYIREAIRLDPDLALAHTSLAAIFVGQRDYAAAIAEYEEALRIDPDAALARLDLAATLAHAGQRDRALIELERCLAGDPEPAIRREAEQQLSRLKRRRWF